MGKRRTKRARLPDLYEAEQEIAEEEKRPGQRYDNVDNFQYELPEDFEDEEIDEDAAFTEEDKAQFGHMFETGNSQLEPGEDSGEETQTAEGLTRDDFSEDDSDADRRFGKPSGRVGKLTKGAEDVDDIFGGVSDAEASGGELDDDDSGGSGGEEKVAQAVRDVLGPARKKRKRQAVQLMDEAAPESEYNLPSAGGEAGELQLADLVRGLGPQKGKPSKAQKQLAQIVRRSQPVAAPLPGPIKARKERQAGYDATKQDIKKWTPIVQVNRETPTLVFAASGNDVPRTSTTAALSDKFRPEEGLEAEVAALLRAAGVQDEKAAGEAEEALALKVASAEELAKRRGELAKMRSLMFKHEEKARHLAKIKSKDYHRRSNRAARKKAEKAGLLEDKDYMRLEAENAELARAKERLTLKHKNSSQWARRALKRGAATKDDGTKAAIAEQLRLGEELRRRVDRMDPVEGSDTDASDASESSGSEGSASEGEGPRGMGRRAAAKARATATDILVDAGGEDEDDVSKSLFSLPFMKRAREKQKALAQQQARSLLAELEEGGEGEGEDNVEIAPQGRKNFGLAGGTQANNLAPDFEPEDPSGSDADEDADAKLERLRAAAGITPKPAAGIGQAGTSASHRAPAPSSKRTRGSTAKPAPTQQPAPSPSAATESRGAAGGSALKSQGVLERVAASQRSVAGRSHLLDGGGVSREEAAPRSVEGSRRVSVGPTPAAAAERPVADAGQDEEDAGRTKADEAVAPSNLVTVTEAAVIEGDDPMEETSGEPGMSQRDLIAQAFAGDDVAAEFDEAKEAEIGEELPKVEAPSLLPGWGSWASHQREPGWMLDARAKAQREKDAARAGRKDARLKGVVISERWDRKAAKYTSPTLPFPFTSVEALEGSMRHPLGSDFNTDSAFRAMTRPAIVKRSGVIIQPLRFSEAVADEKRAVHKVNQYNRPTIQRIGAGMAQPSKSRLQKEPRKATKEGQKSHS